MSTLDALPSQQMTHTNFIFSTRSEKAFQDKIAGFPRYYFPASLCFLLCHLSEHILPLL
jgi:hypothetical protein